MTEHTGLAARLRELGEKATPGEWRHNQWVNQRDNSVMADEIKANGNVMINDVYREEDAALIVTLRNNLPAIIAALEARPAPATEGEVEAVARVLAEAACPLSFSHHRDKFVDDFWSEYEGLASDVIAAARPSREGEMRRALEQIAAREDYSPGETEIREIARAALQPQQQKEA